MVDTKETHRVHFDENRDLVGKDNEITVEQKNSKLDVHLGFLQVNHRYSIIFSVPRTFCRSGDCSEIVLDNATTKPHLRITSATVSQDKIDFQLELLAHKQNLIVEEFCFRLSDVEQPFSVIMNAKVLGKGKGTPLLKNGIHVIHEPVCTGNNESDTSSD